MRVLNNQMRKIGMRMATAFVVLSPVALVPMVAHSDTLGDALTSAYNHSGLLEQNRALLRVADENVASAAAALKPILNWSVTAEYRDTSPTSFFSPRNPVTDVTAQITASLLLYDSGGSKASIDALKETVLATRAGLVSIEQQIMLRAVSAYFNLRQSGEIVALRRNNLRLLTQELRAARDRFELGDITRTDVALAEARLAQARSGLATAEGNQIKAVEEFRNVVGRKPGRLNVPKLPKVETNLKRAKSLAVRSHPDMAQVQHQVASLEHSIFAAKAAMDPTYTLNGSVRAVETYNADTSSTRAAVGVTVQGPIYQGGALSSAVRREIARRDAARGNLHVVRHNVQQEVGNAFADVGIARASLEASERQIRASRVAFRGVREEVKVGSRTTLDVLDAEQELLDAEASRITAQSQQYVAAYTVLASMGLLTAKNMNLPVQQYDPAAYYELVKDGVAARSKQGRQLDKVLRALQKD